MSLNINTVFQYLVLNSECSMDNKKKKWPIKGIEDIITMYNGPELNKKVKKQIRNHNSNI